MGTIHSNRQAAGSDGRVERIWLKPVRRGPMKPVEAAQLVTNRGIVGNANQNGRRQITLISQERWQQVERDLGQSVDPALRRANVMVSGIDLIDSRGKHLRIGECLIEVWGETRPCRTMEDAHSGLQNALDADWGGGAFGIILEGGEIRIGDAVTLLPAPANAPYTNWKSRFTRKPREGTIDAR
jgi:MOSC domain-containing protein YiiM